MADPLKQICDELGVCTEEALFYLEGFRWDLNAATEACRTKTLPSLAADQPPSPENERAAAEEQQGDEKIAAAEESMRTEKIATFLGVTDGSSVADAVKYLSDYNWNVEYAARFFCEHRYDRPEKKLKPTPLPHDGHTAPSYLHGFSGSDGSDLVQDVLSKVPQFLSNTSTNVRIGSPPSASTPRLELTPESIKQFSDVVSEASPPEVLDCLNHSKGNVTDAISYYYDEYSKEKPR